jgi:threonine dehydrogenase-like Zn-dependent dehydrogenase
MLDCGENHQAHSVLDDIVGAGVALVFGVCAIVGIATFYVLAALFFGFVAVVDRVDRALHVATERADRGRGGRE